MPRRGFELIGVSVDNGKSGLVGERFVFHGESVLEHQAKVAFLVAIFANNFPGFFGELSGDLAAVDLWDLFVVGLCHDIGEIKTGDIPDDGRAEHDTKDDAEMEVFRALTESFKPSYDANTATRTFKHLQQKESEGRALYALDKLDAVLTLVFLEQYGVKGDIYDKPQPTAQDIHFAEVVGTGCATDVWAAHFMVQLTGFPRFIVSPVLKLLEMAFMDVRGELPKWWGKEIPPHKK